jgi:hypothetical protein
MLGRVAFGLRARFHSGSEKIMWRETEILLIDDNSAAVI